MTHRAENQILKKINWQMCTFLLALAACVAGSLRVAYNWQNNILIAIEKGQYDRDLINKDIANQAKELNEVKGRTANLEAAVFKSKN